MERDDDRGVTEQRAVQTRAEHAVADKILDGPNHRRTAPPDSARAIGATAALMCAKHVWNIDRSPSTGSATSSAAPGARHDRRNVFARAPGARTFLLSCLAPDAPLEV